MTTVPFPPDHHTQYKDVDQAGETLDVQVRHGGLPLPPPMTSKAALGWGDIPLKCHLKQMRSSDALCMHLPSTPLLEAQPQV